MDFLMMHLPIYFLDQRSLATGLWKGCSTAINFHMKMGDILSFKSSWDLLVNRNGTREALNGSL